MYNFPVNDDWIFFRQVEAFTQGNYTISAILDPSFIAQGLSGQLWSKLFGLSFVSLRFLTLAMLLLAMWGVYNLLKDFNASKLVIVVTLLTIGLNPLIINSALSFMTEIYFLTPFIWALYFFNKWISQNNSKFLLYGSLFTGISILVRQVGVVLVIAVVLLFAYKYIRTKVMLSRNEIAAFAIPLIISVIVVAIWPRHLDGGSVGGFTNITSIRLFDMVYSLPYFGFFLAPLLAFNVSLTKKTKLAIFLLSIPIAVALYKVDIFAPGSVFYVEGFHIKSNFRANFSLFDNVFFKIFLAYFVAFFTLLFIESLRRAFKSMISQDQSFLFLLTFLGMFGVLLFGNDYYDRYLLPAIIAMIFLVVRFLPSAKMQIPKLAIGSIFLIGLMSVILQIDYMQKTSLMWDQAIKLQEETGLVNGILVDDVYAKYSNAKKQNDYTGLINTMPSSSERFCFVQKYTLDTESRVLGVSQGTDDLLNNSFDNPKIYESNKKKGIPKIKSHLDELKYNQEYFSPLYNLVGKKAYVGSWCNIE